MFQTILAAGITVTSFETLAHPKVFIERSTNTSIDRIARIRALSVDDARQTPIRCIEARHTALI